MPAELGDLWALQEELLQAAVDSLDHIPDEEPTLLGAPLRQVIAPPGEFVMDCDQVLVNLGSIGELSVRPSGGGGTSQRRHVTGRINKPTVNLVVSRCCLPVGEVKNTRYTPPSVAETMAAAEQLTADGWALWNGVFSRLVNGSLSLTGCDSVEWLTQVPIGPSGACGGWLLQLRPQLAGYLEAAAS